MSILNLFRDQLSRVIQWENQDPGLLWYRYPSATNEIKNASKLILGPGQGCVLVYEGKVTDILQEEGIYNLETENHPFITSLVRLRQGFESEHKLLLYFFRKADILNQPWGTMTPVKYTDPVYHIPVALGVHGTFSYRMADVSFFFSHITGSKDIYTTEALRDIVNGRLPQLIASQLAAAKKAYLEIDAALNDMAATVQAALQDVFSSLGLNLIDFRILGSQFDDATIERIGRIADVTTDVQAAHAAGLDYVSLEQLRALRDAARNEGGLAGAGAQLGAGMELGKKFNMAKDELTNNPADEIAVKLRKLKLLLDEKIITQADFEEKKKALLSQL